MLFTDRRRSSVILENDQDYSEDDIPHRESQLSSNISYEDKDQITHRLGKKAKDTIKRVRSTLYSPGRNNSKEAIEMKTCTSQDSKQFQEKAVHKRRQSEQFAIDKDAKFNKRRLSFAFEPEILGCHKIQNPQRRYSLYNSNKGNSGDHRKTSSHGLYVKNRPSISRHFLTPAHKPVSQSTSRHLYSQPNLSQRRRIKSSGDVDDHGSISISKDSIECNEGRHNSLTKHPCVPPVKKKVMQSNTINIPVINVKSTEPSPQSAANILETLNAVKLGESVVNVTNEYAPRSQNITKTNIFGQKSTTRPIRVPYRRRVAVSFSNYQSDSPVILSKFKSNRQFDSSF